MAAAPPERASNRAPDKLRAKTAVAVPRGPITRRQHSLANKREENEKRSLLLKLNDDLLEKVLSFLPGRELAAIETVCTHFRYGGWLAANKAPMPEVSAKRKLDWRPHRGSQWRTLRKRSAKFLIRFWRRGRK